MVQKTKLLCRRIRNVSEKVWIILQTRACRRDADSDGIGMEGIRLGDAMEIFIKVKDDVIVRRKIRTFAAALQLR
jgi:hypothetical protein